MTNTNWQWYSGEIDDELSRADGGARRAELRSAAAGIAVAIALIRGFARHETDEDRQLLGRPDARARCTS